jgi:hypothetical protein
MGVGCVLYPPLVVWHSEEVDMSATFFNLSERAQIYSHRLKRQDGTHSNNGRHKLDQKIRNLQQRREKVIKKVDQ